MSGPVNDPKFRWGSTIWDAMKNVLVNIVTAPSKAIGRLFSSGEQVEEPKVDPVTFTAGSSILSPAMEDHILRVADFLRRTPFVNLTLTAVASPADADALKAEVLAARLRGLQKERGLADTAAAVAVYCAERLPAVSLPATVDEQLALLQAREPAPEMLLADLGRRRVEAARQRLIEIEGIPEARLAAEAPPSAVAPAGEAAGEGRVEFGIVAGGWQGGAGLSRTGGGLGGPLRNLPQESRRGKAAAGSGTPWPRGDDPGVARRPGGNRAVNRRGTITSRP